MMKTSMPLLVAGSLLATTILATAQLPVIIVQPISRYINTPGPATFYVIVRGAELNYQWLFNGTPITGGTNRILSLASATPADCGFYSVLITNPSGSVTSQVAVLKIFTATRHNLSGIQAQADGAMNLSFDGETTATFGPYYDLYPLEVSSNLVDWVPLMTLQRPNAALDTLRFLDTNAPHFGQRFYRTPTNQLVTPLTQPTGPYGVGTFSLLLTDPSRTNAARRTNYQFMSTFWYPAVAQAGVLPAKYVEPVVAQTNFYNCAAFGGGSFSSQVAASVTHSISNAPIAANIVKYPVVLYDPGYQGNRRENTDKAEDLASWGYVVIGLDTPDTAVSVFPDGKVVRGQTTGDFVGAIEGRLRDERFVLDELARLNAGDPRLGGQLDLEKVGTFGWSLGGATAAQLCLREPRCKAGVGFDGTFCNRNLLTQTLSVPYLFFCEDDTAASESPPVDDRLPVFNHMVTNAYWVKLISTVHSSFSDYDLICDSSTLQTVWGTPVSGQFLPPARVSQIVRTYLLSFFNKHLKGQDDHLLDGPSPAYPEVEQFMRK